MSKLFTFDGTEDEIRKALPDTDPPVLLMSYVQLTGDIDFAEQFRPYIKKVRDFADNIPPELIEELHRRIIRLLCHDRVSEPKPLSRDTITRLMSLCVGEPVPDHYMPMLLSELGVERNDAAAEFTEIAKNSGYPENFRVGVIGAGLSGICAAALMRRAGMSFKVFEKNQSVGGTWWENKYPGCGVDTMNHWYSYSFAMKHDWTRYFVQRKELHDYLEDCVRKFNLMPDICLETKVESAHFDESRLEWDVTYRDARGQQHRESFNALICAVGQLNNPAIPEIEGIDTFKGQAFHSARWPEGLDIKGKRVALIGTGATGTQLAPAIVDDVASLAIYQRSAHWVTNRPNYTKPVENGKKWALAHIPFYAKWYRFQILWAYGDGLYSALIRDMNWENPTRSISAKSEEVRKLWEAYLEQTLADRPDLLEKSRPRFPPYGKRPLFDNKWFDTLKKPHVSLIQDRIERVTETGIVTADGVARDTDIIVFATGFQASKMVYSVDVTGRNGRKLREVWNGDNPRAYLGSTVLGFPNFFLLYGPNTNLAHGGSIAFIAERQSEYAIRCLAELKKRGAAAMDVTEEAYERYDQQVVEQHSKMIWSIDGLESWYKNKTGRVTTNSPWSLLKIWELSRQVVPEDYNFLYETTDSRKTVSA